MGLGDLLGRMVPVRPQRVGVGNDVDGGDWYNPASAAPPDGRFGPDLVSFVRGSYHPAPAAAPDGRFGPYLVKTEDKGRSCDFFRPEPLPA